MTLITTAWQELRRLESDQRSAVIASFLGWMLDAFDFFIMIMILDNVAADFHTTVKAVAYGVTLTLAMRPVGAFIFGGLADRYGRRPVLMIDVLLFSALELASGFAPDLETLLLLRLLFGIAMGGEWGIGSSLAMETIPASARGIVSGLLQEGYAVGFLVATIVYWALFKTVGWRGMFIVGAVPSLLVLFIRAKVKESPAWAASNSHSLRDMVSSITRNWKMFLYIVVLMSCFNAFSHGTQDLYKVFLAKQMKFDTASISLLLIVANIGAIAGGLSFGALSERIGRRKAILISSLLALLVVPLWAYSTSPAMLGLGVFLMQFMVQGAWGVVPVHLNELSPPEVRGTFPGFTYQLGNFVISLAAPLQAGIAESHGNDYALALASTAAVVALAVAAAVFFGPERKGVAMHQRQT